MGRGQCRSQCQWFHCWAHIVFSCLGKCSLGGFKGSVWKVYFPKFSSQMSSHALITAPPSFPSCLFPYSPAYSGKDTKRKFSSSSYRPIGKPMLICIFLDGAKTRALAPCAGFPPPQEILPLTSCKVRTHLLRYLLPCSAPQLRTSPQAPTTVKGDKQALSGAIHPH